MPIPRVAAGTSRNFTRSGLISATEAGQHTKPLIRFGNTVESAESLLVSLVAPKILFKVSADSLVCQDGGFKQYLVPILSDTDAGFSIDAKWSFHKPGYLLFKVHNEVMCGAEMLISEGSTDMGRFGGTSL